MYLGIILISFVAKKVMKVSKAGGMYRDTSILDIKIRFIHGENFMAIFTTPSVVI